jgi:hypothetical protein
MDRAERLQSSFGEFAGPSAGTAQRREHLEILRALERVWVGT